MTISLLIWRTIASLYKMQIIIDLSNVDSITKFLEDKVKFLKILKLVVFFFRSVSSPNKEEVYQVLGNTLLRFFFNQNK